MILILALQATVAATSPQQAFVAAYQDCLAPIVRGNELAGKESYQPLETVLGQIELKCSKERAAAREALSAIIVANHPEHPQPSESQKEQLIGDATIRWANNVVARMVAEEAK